MRLANFKQDFGCSLCKRCAGRWDPAGRCKFSFRMLCDCYLETRVPCMRSVLAVLPHRSLRATNVFDLDLDPVIPVAVVL